MLLQSTFYASKKILVIDDCEPIRAAIKGMLQKIGFKNIVTANNGATAIQYACKQTFDFILADFNLGDNKDGYQVFQELKHRKLLSLHCCFIIISAENEKPLVHGIIELQPDDYILKPFTYQGLEMRLARALSKKHVLTNVFNAIQDEQLDQAIKNCDKALSKSPKSALVILRMKAELLIESDKPKQALQIYQSVLNKRTTSWAILGQAIASFKNNELDLAEAQFFELLERPETQLEAYDWLAKLNILKEDPQSALEMFLQASEISPRNIERQQAIAHLAVANKELDIAEKAYQQIIKNTRQSIFDTADNYLNYARCIIDLCDKSKPENIKKHIDKCLLILDDLEQRNYSGKVKLQKAIIKARIKFLQGDPEAAEKLLYSSEHIEQSALSIDDKLDQAKIYFSTGNVCESDKLIEEISQIEVKETLTSSSQQILINNTIKQQEVIKSKIRQLYAEGSEFYKNKQYPEAVECFLQGYAYMPENPQLALNLIQSIVKVGSFSVANHNQSKIRVICQTCLELIEEAELSENSIKKFQAVKPAMLTMLGH